MPESHMLLVGGFPSGGTDLLKTILNAHPAIYLNGELPRLSLLLRQGYSASSRLRSTDEVAELRRRLRELDPWGNLENVDFDFTELLKSEGELALSTVLYHLSSGKTPEVWGNKTPQNSEQLPELIALFPSAQFLLIVRDVRDVCLSWKRKWGKDVLWCADKWARRMRLAVDYAQSYGGSAVKLVRYEELLIETEAVCRDMVDFLGLPFSENMLSHEDHVDKIIDGKINYGRPVIPDNFGKWRKGFDAPTVRRIEEIAFEVMPLLGYQAEYATHHHSLTRPERLRAVVRDSLAILLIGNRASQDNSLRARIRTLIYEIRKQTLRA
jgi:hypothetical protein